MVRRHPDVVGLEQPGSGESVLDAADFSVDMPEHLDRLRRPDAPGVRRRIERPQPEDGHRRIHTRKTDGQKGVDGVPVAGRRRPIPRGRLAEHRQIGAGALGHGEVRMQDDATRDRRIVQDRRPARPRTRDQHPPAGRLQHLADRRRREQPPFPRGDRGQGLTIRGIEESARLDPGEVDAVAHEPMRLRVGARGKRRSIDARDRRVDGVMAGEHDAAPADGRQAGHHVGRDVVGPQAVDHHQQVPTRGRLRRRGDDQTEREQQPDEGCASMGAMRASDADAEERSRRAWARHAGIVRANDDGQVTDTSGCTGRRRGSATRQSRAAARPGASRRSSVGFIAAAHIA